MAQLLKGGLVRGHDKPIHGSCAIYFPGGIRKSQPASTFTIPKFQVLWLKKDSTRFLFDPKKYKRRVPSSKSLILAWQVPTQLAEGGLLKMISKMRKLGGGEWAQKDDGHASWQTFGIVPEKPEQPPLDLFGGIFWVIFWKYVTH